MSKENFIKFYNEYVPKNSALQKQLDGINNEQEFTKLAMVEGPKGGFTFTAAEITECMEAHKASRQAKGLSDKQLDKVTGGTGPSPGGISGGNLMIRNLQGSTIPANLSSVLEGGTTMCCW